ncbi:MAG: glycosyltransferase family 4 protein [Sphingomonadales bacterium]|nr:glycosyltransferase family 4 protein [Sphingomonadales bacterium]
MPPPLTAKPTIIVCANQAWNLVNFRSGLIEALLANGFAVEAVAPPDAPMEKLLKAMGCGFTPVAIDSAGLDPRRDMTTFLALRRIIGRLQPVAWLSWTIKPNVYGSLAAGLAGIPAFPNVSGLGTAFIRRNLLTLIAKQLYRAAFRKAAVVFFQNRDDEAEFVEARLVRSEQSRVLPGSGVDVRSWAPLSSDRPRRRQFLMLARVVSDKGVREYVAAARMVRQAWPDARFILMGAVNVPNRTAIPEQEVRGWVAEGVLEHLSPVSDVRPYIAEADFVVLPSYREGLSRVLVEAGAMGRPAITTDVAGCRDIIRHGENGFLCEPKNANALAHALTLAANLSDNAWQCMAQAARARVVAEFSQERVTSLYLQALHDAGVHVGRNHE